MSLSIVFSVADPFGEKNDTTICQISYVFTTGNEEHSSNIIPAFELPTLSMTSGQNAHCEYGLLQATPFILHTVISCWYKDIDYYSFKSDSLFPKFDC